MNQNSTINNNNYFVINKTNKKTLASIENNYHITI